MVRKTSKPSTRPASTPASQPAADEGQPRLPHERDESVDSQDDAPREVMRRAADDVKAGRQDTDRGPQMDHTYQRQKRRG